MPLKDLLEEISRLHFPHPPASPQEVEAFEQRMGWPLDPELRALYLHCNGANLFKPFPDSPFMLLPLSKIVRARVAIRGQDDDSRGPASWYAFCDVGDGDYVLVDVSRQEGGTYPVLDGYHEMFPDPEYCQQIAGSVSEFLEKVLHGGGEYYWLK